MLVAKCAFRHGGGPHRKRPVEIELGVDAVAVFASRRIAAMPARDPVHEVPAGKVFEKPVRVLAAFHAGHRLAQARKARL